METSLIHSSRRLRLLLRRFASWANAAFLKGARGVHEHFHSASAPPQTPDARALWRLLLLAVYCAAWGGIGHAVFGECVLGRG